MTAPACSSTSAPHAVSVWQTTVTVAMGYIPLGTVFGFLFVQAGASAWLAVLASVLVYAGAAQYMMVPLLAAGVSPLTVAMTTLVVNARHVFYGLSLLERFPLSGWRRWYMVFALTDETYSVLTTLPGNATDGQRVWIAGLNHAWWVLGTALGAVLGGQVQLAWQGLDFVLAALFAVLAVEQWRQRFSSLPLWTALGAYAVAYAAFPAHALLVSMALCLVAATAWALREPKPAEGGGV